MAAINDEVYKRVREKGKEHNLTEQELKVIDTARDKLQTHTYTGGFIGSSTAFFIGKKRGFNPLQTLAVAAGGFLLGSQMGLISGALAGIKAINTLPNPQRIINIIREVQMESIKNRSGAGPSRSTPPNMIPQQMSQQELNNVQNPQDQFSPEINDNIGGEKVWDSNPSFSNKKMEELTDAPKVVVNQKPQPSAWDRIRAENLPNNSWAKIRMEAQKNPETAQEIERNKAARANRLRENAGFGDVDDVPRTREESLQKGTSRKNQWGDSLE